MTLRRVFAAAVVLVAANLAEWSLWSSTSAAECVEPSVRDRGPGEPVNDIVPPTPPNNTCPPGYELWPAANGVLYCVRSCTPPKELRELGGGTFVCLDPCPPPEFTQDGANQALNCYSCPPGFIWLAAMGQCCRLNEVGCGNTGAAFVGTGSGPTLFHVGSETSIRILTVEGTVTRDSLGDPVPVEPGNRFHECNTIRLEGGSKVTWQKIPPNHKPDELATSLPVPPYDLLSGTATIDQFGACMGSENCGYSLPNGLSVIAANTQAGEGTSFIVSYDPDTGTGSVKSLTSSDRKVNVYGPAGNKLAAVPAGKTLPLGANSGLRINEVSYDPNENPEDPFEYVELYNAGSTTVYLDGMLLTDEGNNGTGEMTWLFPGAPGGMSNPVLPGGYVLIVADGIGCPFAADWETVGLAPDTDDPNVPNMIMNVGTGPDLALGNTGDGITLSTGVTTAGVIPCNQIIDGVSWETGGIGDVTSLGPMTCQDTSPHPGYTNGGSTFTGTLQRCFNGTDTDNSSADFYVAPRTPRAANNCGATGVDDPDPIVVKAFRLRQNEPNPFNPTTAISFSIPKPGRVTLRVYDAQGRIIRTLLDRDFDQPSQARVVWDGQDDHGVTVHSGVYFYRLEANGSSASRKMVVLR